MKLFFQQVFTEQLLCEKPWLGMEDAEKSEIQFLSCRSGIMVEKDVNHIKEKLPCFSYSPTKGKFLLFPVYLWHVWHQTCACPCQAILQFSVDTGWVAYSLTQFWHRLPRVRVLSHRLRAQSHKTTSNDHCKSQLVICISDWLAINWGLPWPLPRFDNLLD